jgi:hypothetical protein
MKVHDLIEMEIDIDVYDDVCEELAIAMCGPVLLTADGERYFEEVLEYPVSLVDDIALVSVDGDDWENKLMKAKEFFEAAAGFCSVDDYAMWFKEVR